jgi:20S proteasome alpha/beta subunit
MNFFSLQQLIQCSILIIIPTIIHANSAGSYGGRHSYSLTTFDPSGNLDQVVRAIRASTLGVPIVALALSGETMEGESSPSTSSTSQLTTASAKQHAIPSNGGIYISVPMRFLATSPLLIDDGTPRIVPLTSSLCLVHTGVGADGRALSEVAVKLVMDYKYLYGEDMELQELLAGLSAKMQEMTMKAGSRPYGCALLVCSLGEGGVNAMYRVDPSGAVVLTSSVDPELSLDSRVESGDEKTTKSVGRRRSVTLMGNWETQIQNQDTIRHELEKRACVNEEQIQNLLVDAARQTFSDESGNFGEMKLDNEQIPVLFASFTHERGLEIKRITK